jgi:hypothetical protein
MQHLAQGHPGNSLLQLLLSSAEEQMQHLSDSSMAAVKIRQYLLVSGCFWYDFIGSHAASCMHFQDQKFSIPVWSL